MGRKPGNTRTVAGLLTSLGLVVPAATLAACETSDGIENDVGVGTENPPPFDTPMTDFGIRDGGPIGTENPAPPDFGPEDMDAPSTDEDASDEDASSEDAGEDGAG